MMTAGRVFRKLVVSPPNSALIELAIPPRWKITIQATVRTRSDVQNGRSTAYSARRLHLAGPAIRETELRGPDAAYRFRYSGLKLVVRSGGRWFLLPASWTPGNGAAALLLADTDELRVEFRPGR